MKAVLFNPVWRVAPLIVAASFGMSLSLWTAVSMAQDAGASDGPPPVAGIELHHLQARVVGVEPSTNTVTVQGETGNITAIAVDPQLVHVSDLRVGDVLNIGFRNALLVQAVKAKSNDGIRERRESTVAFPASGGVVSSARRVEVLATIQKIDLKHRLVTLRGPQQAETLDVAPDIPLDQFKPGDMIQAEFWSAVAVQVQPRAPQ